MLRLSIPGQRPRRRRAAGFSLVEVMIAAALLLMIAVGVLPLFARSMMNNVTGSDASTSSNAAVDAVEDASQLRFNASEISWATAANFWSMPTEFLPVAGDDWVGAVAPGQRVQFTRLGRVRQYQVTELETTGMLGAPLAGNSDPGVIHLKEVEMQITNERLSGGPRYTVRLIKSY